MENEINKVIDNTNVLNTLQKELMKQKLNKVAISREILLEKLDVLDIEFAIATNVIEKETGKKVDLPEGMEELMDRYWRYVFTRLRAELTQKTGENKNGK